MCQHKRTSLSNDAEALQDEADPFPDRDPGKLDQLVAVAGVGRDHRRMGPHGFVEVLPALAVLPEDLRLGGR
jgi:hypothetical protein